MRKSEKIILSLAILLIALFLRLIGLDWDQGQHLHPDERFLTMVETAIKIPKSLSEYLNPQVSPMNPYNNNFGFFVYGVFPLNLTKILGEITHNNSYFNIHLLGRALSAIFDVGTVVLLFKIGKKVFRESTGFLASFLYSIMVLPIQLSHFFAVDTYLNFFLVFCFYLLILFIGEGLSPGSPKNKLKGIDKSLLSSITLGISFGLALACKITALYFIPIVLLGLFFFLLKTKKLKISIICLFLFIFLSYLSFRFNQPQAFATHNFLNLNLNPRFVSNLKELNASADPNGWYPPAIQWISTKPIVFPLKNLVLWGLGIPLGIICVVAVFFSLFKVIFSLISILKNKRKFPVIDSQFPTILILIWIAGVFIYQGIQFGKPSRYFLPIYPFLALLSAQFLTQLSIFLRKKIPNRLFLINPLFFILMLLYPLSFISIYTHPHSRVVASKWIYNNIPPGSVLSYEHWDDGLPLGVDGKSNSIYKFEELALFAPDIEEKWQKINQQLERIDYLILSSNRLWGSIPKLPKKYPISSKFYQDLFEEKLNFKKIAEFNSYLCFPPIGESIFCLPDQPADESFTVYDHPTVMIFKKEI